MIPKIIKSLQDKFLQFLEIIAPHDRSGVINDLLLPNKNHRLMKTLADAYREQSNDPLFQQEVLDWDITMSDGFNAVELEEGSNPKN